MPSLASACATSRRDRKQDDLIVGLDGQPPIGLHFGVKLTRGPAGVAEGEEASLWPLPLADGSQHLEGSSHRDIAVDMQCGFLAIVGRVQNKAAAGAIDLRPWCNCRIQV
jgi:hypothetical protein